MEKLSKRSINGTLDIMKSGEVVDEKFMNLDSNYFNKSRKFRGYKFFVVHESLYPRDRSVQVICESLYPQNF